MAKIFNHELLLLARQYRGMSQAEVAEIAQLDQGHYSRIERGLLNGNPSDVTVSAISEAVKFPSDFFFQDQEITGLPVSVHDVSWRKRASVNSSDLKRLHAELNLRVMHLRELMTAVEIDGELPLPRLDVDEFGGADKVAQYMRRTWMVPDGPIRNLTALCERAGILVVVCNFPEKVDGMTIRLRGIPPMIFLNARAPADRMRHSLAHELGHLIMHSIPTDEMEDQADMFAGEFLAPIAQLRPDLIGGKISLERLVQLKKYWKVSVASLLYRAGSAKLISPNQSNYLWRQLSARGWRITEPEESQFPREQVKLFDHLFSLHSEDLGYSSEDFAKIFRHDEADLEPLYGIAPSKREKPALRLVR